MTPSEAILLGIVQGITEFLPVSSSGHLMLMQALLGIDDLHKLVFFDLVCHAGTLLAIVIVFFQRLTALLGKDRETLFRIAIGTLPLFGVAAVLPHVEKLFGTPAWLWMGFFITAALLLIPGKEMPAAVLHQYRWRNAFLVGCVQGIAVIPGISRSGSTISGARFLGFPKLEAAEFSFFLVIPAILGGIILKLTQGYFHPEKIFPADLPISTYLWGFFASFLAGMAALPLVINLVLHNALKYCAWYCIVIGFFCLVYFALI